MSKRPIAPYVALIVAPLLAWPIAVLILRGLTDCGEDEPWWRLGDFELALLPALSDFLPLAWVLSRERAMKRAAVLAGGIGAVRYAVVQGTTLWYSSMSPGQSLNADCTVSALFAVGLTWMVIGLWVVSLVLAVVLWRTAGLRGVD